MPAIAEPSIEHLYDIAEALCRRRVDAVVHAGGGGHSRIYRVDSGGDCFALKVYPPRGQDPRDRLGTEVKALRFLEAQGVKLVPRVLAADAERGFALLEWIAGAAVIEVGPAEIDAAVAFLGDVRDLGAAAGAEAMPLASEACLSGAEIVRQVETRKARLLQLSAREPELAAFLDDEFAPALAEIHTWARDGYAAAGIDFAAELAPHLRTLIPADFGFHNALRRPDGSLAFVDFEYFGWDDPVKAAADFLLHPAMTLAEEMKRRFGAGMCDRFAHDTTFVARLRTLFALFGMRWCLILLNEFLPERWAQRAFAGGQGDWRGAKMRQLHRSRQALGTLRATYRDFAYGN